MKPPRILIVAGSDSGGGAGVQADIKTVTMMGGFAMSALTAVTAQNSLGVEAVHIIPPEMVIAQIDAVVCDLGVDAVKIGMIGSAVVAAKVAARLESLRGVPIVFDPVMVATSGATLADQATIASFERLMTLAAVVTPNAEELEALTGRRIETVDDMEAAAQLLCERTGTAILAKGGHLVGPQIVDLLVPPRGNVLRWRDDRIESRHTHGTGCTLASAVATGLGRGKPLEEAVQTARAFVRAAIASAPGYGAGHGPMGHASVR